MSFINEALKKAEKDKQFSQYQHIQLTGKFKPTKNVGRNALRKCLIWLAAGILCMVGIFWASTALQKPQRDTEVTLKMPKPQKSLSSDFGLKKIDVEPSAAPANLRLTGILYDTQRPLAIINGRVVAEGALISGAKLLEIQPNYVKLSLKGEELTLKIK